MGRAVTSGADSDSQSLLRSYYEREAELEVRTGPRGQRVDVRANFIALLDAEGRQSVVDFGSGPGHDGEAFIAAGVRFVGVDLAVGNARLGRANGLRIIPASITAPPIRAGSFEAGWSMSTLMHLPAEEAAAAVEAMSSCLEADAPLTVGVWGSHVGRDVESRAIEGERRPFHLRTADQNRRLLSAAGEIQWATVWDAGPEDWEYQVFRVRVSA